MCAIFYILWISEISSTDCSQYLLTTTDDRNKSINPLVHMYSHSPLATLTRVFAVALAVGFLLIPVFILFLVAMSRAAMVLTVFAFVLAFSVMISVVSGARTQDLLIGTAASVRPLSPIVLQSNGQ